MDDKDRTVLNQVCGWVESKRIKELEKQLKMFNSSALFDWMESKSNQRGFICLTFYLHDYYPMNTINMILHKYSRKKIKNGCVRYMNLNEHAEFNTALIIKFKNKYAKINVDKWSDNDGSGWIFMLTRECGEKLIEFIDSKLQSI